MIPNGYAAAIHAWAISPELSDADKTARRQSLLDQRDELVTGQTKGGKGVGDLVSASLNGKQFQWEVGVSKAEKLTVLSDVLQRLGLIAAAALPVTNSHGNFAGLQR